MITTAKGITADTVVTVVYSLGHLGVGPTLYLDRDRQ